MIKNFKADLEVGKQAEKIVLNKLRKLYPHTLFEDVSNNPKYRNTCDILADKSVKIEVKNDSIIARSDNVLLEEYVYYEDDWTIAVPGTLSRDIDIYIVYSPQRNGFYVFDFKVIKDIYKMGRFIGRYNPKPNPDQVSDVYILSIDKIEYYGGYLGFVNCADAQI